MVATRVLIRRIPALDVLPFLTGAQSDVARQKPQQTCRI